METPVPYLCGKITSAESDTSKVKMVWSGQWGMKETDKVRREAPLGRDAFARTHPPCRHLQGSPDPAVGGDGGLK
jgi:hypothetical protein